jgi:predicted DNA-binding protein (UPF0251 family)
MPRAKAIRTLQELPIIKGFRPLWMRPNYRSAITLHLEEYEVLRLIDYEGLIHEQAAEKMLVSRPTITRIYEQARKKLATALVEGRSMLIEGGEIQLDGVHYLCEDCQHKFVCSTEAQIPTNCPKCASQRIISLSECFIRGCRRCRRCR